MSALRSLHIQNTYAELPDTFYRRVMPQPLHDPKLVSLNEPLARQLGLDTDHLDRQSLAELGAGQWILEGMDPLAMKYTGHQFGVYNPDLGDGRGLLLCETIDRDGQRWDWHLKGAGRTPWSRFGDGRAVLRSTIREYLCSEAMHGLGIPTTRGLFIVSASDPVYRETQETAATLMRVARTHLRFGHFEYAFYHQGEEAVRTLAEYAIRTCFPDLQEKPAPDRYEALLTRILVRTGQLIAQWQAIGFAHGVMNTDNMSIIGDTFDYGPYAFLDDFQAGFISNHTDQNGRYAFNQQPMIGFWNGQCLARTFTALLSEDKVRRALGHYEKAYNSTFLEGMRRKLGLSTERDDDLSLIMDLFRLLHEHRVDYTLFFRHLSRYGQAGAPPIRDLFVDRDACAGWLARYEERLQLEGDIDDSDRHCRMLATNPKYILRNYLAQNAIEKAQQGDFTEVNRLLDLLQHPFDEQPDCERYANEPPDWGRRLEISCSS